MGHAQRLGAYLHTARLATTDDGQRHAAFAQQGEAQAILRIERLKLVAAVGEVDAAVGQHAIHVHHQHFDRPGQGLYCLHKL